MQVPVQDALQIAKEVKKAGKYTDEPSNLGFVLNMTREGAS